MLIAVYAIYIVVVLNFETILLMCGLQITKKKIDKELQEEETVESSPEEAEVTCIARFRCDPICNVGLQMKKKKSPRLEAGGSRKDIFRRGRGDV